MKYITFGIGYLLAVLVGDVSSADYYISNVPKTTRNSPYNFFYFMTPNSVLVLEITLKNIPPSVTAVTVTQSTYVYLKPQTETFEVNVDKKTGEDKVIILHLSLTQYQIWVDVQLYDVGGFCNETIITEGRAISSNPDKAVYWDTIQKKIVFQKESNWKYDTISDSCLAPKACEIILDLKDTCKEQPKSTYGDKVECYKNESQYICTFVRAAYNKNELVLSQIYIEDDSVIGPLGEIQSKTTKLSIKLELELFDNNTSVKLAPKYSESIATIRSGTLSITAQDISKTSNVTILKYTNTTDVQFSCVYEHQFTNIHIGFINTTDNTIKTHNTINMKRNNFTMADNGTILCCIVYEYKIYYQEMTITRFVKNKTLLIYQTKESASTNLTAESNEQQKQKAPCQDVWWLYLLLTLLGTTVLLLTFYIVMKQLWCTKPQPAEETVELDNYCQWSFFGSFPLLQDRIMKEATTNQVLYANLDFVHNESRAENQTEESPYANIVGVLHPL